MSGEHRIASTKTPAYSLALGKLQTAMFSSWSDPHKCGCCVDMRTLLLFLIFGGFVQLRKPDVEMFRVAEYLAQAPVQHVVFNAAPMSDQNAEGLSIRSILHTDCKSTCVKLALLEMAEEKGVMFESC